jgi:hypothetical protein
MSLLVHDAGNRAPTPGLALRTFLRSAQAIIDTYAQYRVKSALSPSQLQQTEGEIRRCRRLLTAHK